MRTDNKKTKMNILEFRVLQLELALGSLMQVVAFPEKHGDFRNRMSEALKIADERGAGSFLDIMMEEGGEA